MAKLKGKQQAFVDEYLKDLNATQAAIRAGYKPKWAGTNADKLLKNTNVSAAIERAKQERAEATKIDAEYVLRRLKQIDELDVLDIVDENYHLKKLGDWPKVWRQSISGLDISTIARASMSGGEPELLDEVLKKIKWPDKVKNLELLGKHVDVQAFKDRVAVDADEALLDRILNARKR